MSARKAERHLNRGHEGVGDSLECNRGPAHANTLVSADTIVL